MNFIKNFQYIRKYKLKSELYVKKIWKKLKNSVHFLGDILNDDRLKFNYVYNTLLGRGEGEYHLLAYNFSYNRTSISSSHEIKRNTFDYHEVCRMLIWEEFHLTRSYR